MQSTTNPGVCHPAGLSLQALHARLRAHFATPRPLSEAEFAAVLAHGTLRAFPRRHYLLREGQRATEAYFIVAGLVKLVQTAATGKAHVLAFAQEGQWEGDCQAYFAGAPATLALQCLEPTTAWCLPLAGYQQLCASFPRFQTFFFEESLRGGWVARQRLASLLALPPQARYEQLRREQPDLVRRLTNVQLAAYLGVSREMLSRWAQVVKCVR